MNARTSLELEQLTLAERQALGEALLASAESEASAPFISEAQRAELRARVAYHAAHPEEGGITLDALEAKLKARRAA